MEPQSYKQQETNYIKPKQKADKPNKQQQNNKKSFSISRRKQTKQ